MTQLYTASVRVWFRWLDTQEEDSFLWDDGWTRAEMLSQIPTGAKYVSEESL